METTTSNPHLLHASWPICNRLIGIMAISENHPVEFLPLEHLDEEVDDDSFAKYEYFCTFCVRTQDSSFTYASIIHIYTYIN